MDRRTFLGGATVATLGLTAGAQEIAAAPKVKVLIPGFSPEQMAELHEAAPNADLVVIANDADLLANAADAEGSYGFTSPAFLRAAKKLKWVQVASAGVEGVVNIPELRDSNIILTNMQGIYAPEIADQALGYLLSFTRCLGHFIHAQPNEDLPGSRTPDLVLDELQDKTMLVIALGGIGTEIARRAHAFGMRVLATDPKVTKKPEYVAELHQPEALHSLLPKADVIASAVPITPKTRHMLAEREFGLMKPGVIILNVSRGGVIDTDALVAALASKKVAAAGLDVTEPEPLPKGHPLWKQNILLTSHTAGTSEGGFRRAFLFFRDNLRRFANGETLQHIVDKQAGY